MQTTPERRVWDGIVRGRSDFWVILAPETRRPTEWVYREEALELSPLRFCHAVLDDDSLVMGGTDSEHDDMFADLLGML